MGKDRSHRGARSASGRLRDAGDGTGPPAHGHGAGPHGAGRLGARHRGDRGQAARNGVSIEGATIYTTASPCWPCFKLIANAGCERIVYGEFYRDERIFQVAGRLGIELVQVEVAPLQPAPAPRVRAGG